MAQVLTASLRTSAIAQDRQSCGPPCADPGWYPRRRTWSPPSTTAARATARVISPGQWRTPRPNRPTRPAAYRWGAMMLDGGPGGSLPAGGGVHAGEAEEIGD